MDWRAARERPLPEGRVSHNRGTGSLRPAGSVSPIESREPDGKVRGHCPSAPSTRAHPGRRIPWLARDELTVPASWSAANLALRDSRARNALDADDQGGEGLDSRAPGTSPGLARLAHGRHATRLNPSYAAILVGNSKVGEGRPNGQRSQLRRGAWQASARPGRRQDSARSTRRASAGPPAANSASPVAPRLI
jgi:hypothetical protein